MIQRLRCLKKPWFPNWRFHETRGRNIKSILYDHRLGRNRMWTKFFQIGTENGQYLGNYWAKGVNTKLFLSNLYFSQVLRVLLWNSGYWGAIWFCFQLFSGCFHWKGRGMLLFMHYRTVRYFFRESAWVNIHRNIWKRFKFFLRFCKLPFCNRSCVSQSEKLSYLTPNRWFLVLNELIPVEAFERICRFQSTRPLVIRSAMDFSCSLSDSAIHWAVPR